MPLENWLSLPFMPVWFNNKIIALYRMFMTVIGVKMKSRVYGVPVLEHTEYEKMCHDIVAGRRSYIFNDENWGLDQESLEEFVINTAGWDKEYERENEHR